MAYKNPYDERARAARRKHYNNNKEAYLTRAKAQREELRQFVRELKENQPCADCQIKYPYYVMQYDHIGTDKLGSVSRIVLNGSKTKVLEEIAKCDLVCANCHAIRTHARVVSQALK